jgi:hypothetical protein
VALKAAIVKAWETVTEGMLLGKAIWNIRTKKVLRTVDAAPSQGSVHLSRVELQRDDERADLWRRRGRHGPEAGAAPHFFI